MFHLKGGPGNWVVDPTETTGTQAVQTSYDNDSVSQMHPSDLSDSGGGGCAIDSNLDIFVSQSFDGSDSFLVSDDGVPIGQTAAFSPPEQQRRKPHLRADQRSRVASGDLPASASDFSWEGIRDTVINSQAKPTLVALPMVAGNDNGNGGGVQGHQRCHQSHSCHHKRYVDGQDSRHKLHFVESVCACAVAIVTGGVGNCKLGAYSHVAATTPFTGGAGVFQAATAANAAAHFFQVVCPLAQGTVVLVKKTTLAKVTQFPDQYPDWGNAYTAAA